MQAPEVIRAIEFTLEGGLLGRAAQYAAMWNTTCEAGAAAERKHRWPWDYCARCEGGKPTDQEGFPLRDGDLVAKAGWAIWDDTGCVCPDCQRRNAVARPVGKAA